MSSKPDNMVSVRELCSKALTYTHTAAIPLDQVYWGAAKSSYNLSGNFVALLEGGVVRVCLDPALQRGDPVVCAPAQTNITDMDWSTHRQCDMALLSKRHCISYCNVLEDRISYSAHSATPLCCIKTSPHDPFLLLTAGKEYKVWDMRQESPVLSTPLLTSPCCAAKHSSKSCCFVVRNENTVVGVRGGGLGVLDMRNVGQLVETAETGFRSVFSVESSEESSVESSEESRGRSLIVQGGSGRVRVFGMESLKVVESSYAGDSSGKPVSGLAFRDDFFIQGSEKMSLFNELLRRPVLDFPDDCRSVLSTANRPGSDSLFCSSKGAAYLVSFH